MRVGLILLPAKG